MYEHVVLSQQSSSYKVLHKLTDKDGDAVSTLRAKNTISTGPAEHIKARLWLLLQCVTLHGVYLFQTTNCLEYSTEVFQSYS